METLRKPFLFLAIALSVVIVLVELGAAGFLRTNPPLDTDGNTDASQQILNQLPTDSPLRDLLSDGTVQSKVNNLASKEKPPGLGIPYMALVDGLVLFTAALIGAALFISKRLLARIQGCVTCIFSIVLIIGAIVLIFIAIGLLILMVSLFLAVPFGTIAYLAIYGFFNSGAAAAVLSLLLLLKLGFGGSLIAAQQRFLENKGLVLLVITSLVCNVIISFLHGFVPGILVSITDAVAAIIVAVIAVIWAIFFVIGSIGSIIKVIRPDPG